MVSIEQLPSGKYRAADLGGLLMDLQDLLQRDVDVVTERGPRPQIAQRVLAHAVEQ